MTPVQVIGIGLDGRVGLTSSVQQTIEQSTLLVGSDRHLSYFPDHPADRLSLTDLHQTLQTIRQLLPPSHSSTDPPSPTSPTLLITILVSGDPLFFGFGRLLLAELPPESLTFHPHLSSVQLAFSRIKVPWQDAKLISAHGRSLDELTQILQQGAERIAVLTDEHNTPAAIARLILALELPGDYQCWVCENLGGVAERVQSFSATDLVHQTFAPLNVVVLLRSPGVANHPLDLRHLPALGLPDHSFLSFSDRPGLMTKREVRLLVLGELALQAGQTVWDIGAGTGSVSIEIARLCPDSQIYAVEKTAAGMTLIQQNSERFQVNTITSISGSAPAALASLPDPDRIFIGGSGGYLEDILRVCETRLKSGGVIVLAIATLEHLNRALTWLQEQQATGRSWQSHFLHVQLSRSVPIAALTRFTPLNPVTLLTIKPPNSP